MLWRWVTSCVHSRRRGPACWRLSHSRVQRTRRSPRPRWRSAQPRLRQGLERRRSYRRCSSGSKASTTLDAVTRASGCCPRTGSKPATPPLSRRHDHPTEPVREAGSSYVRRRVDAGETGVIEESYEHHHARTYPLDEQGQGDAHVAFTFVAHRAVVEVDVELGLVRVVEIATSQDVGKVLNPLSVLGQIEGGIAQGVGLATMEELLVRDGRVLNPTFTDYLIPTALDMPAIKVIALIEEPEPGAPFGAKGVGEAPTISSSAAVAAAIRAATGRPIQRLPVRPTDIVERLVAPHEPQRWR